MNSAGGEVDIDLPLEVWENIFLRCLPSDYSHPSIKEAPLLLCRVSRKWRRNAQNINTLWITLFAHFDLAKKPMLLRTGLRRWLSRARPRRLTLVLKVSMPSRGVEPSIKQEFRSLLSYIARNAERFHFISVTDGRIHPGACFTPPVASPELWGEGIVQVVSDYSHRFTNLITFEYCRTYYLHQHPLLATMDPPFQLPQSVRKLVLNPGPIDVPRPISPIPTLQHVEHLNLQGYCLTPAEFLQQLASCPSIITGSFTILGNGNNDIVPVTTPVRLQQIRSLTLYPMLYEGNLEFLGTHIHGLSNTLTELSIDSMVKPSPTINSAALAPHRGECLTALTLMNLDVIAEDLVAFLTSCRALQSLFIKLPSIRETEIVGMLERTTALSESLGVLPILKKFSIVIYMDLHQYIPFFFEAMVKSRRNETLLRDSACLIEVVDLIHLGVGDQHKPEVDQLIESLAGLTGLVLNIEGPKDL